MGERGAVRLMSHGPYRGKRALDLAVLCISAIPAGVLAGACAFLVWRSSPGPIIFRQERMGRGGRPFIAFKFRTMIDGPNPLFPDATRITAAGRLLRRSSLDELPQLINVVRGEMSIVGPRPALRYQVGRYDEKQRGRLSVRPGITGLAQVSGRNSLLWADRIAMDLDYVSRQSLALDLQIIFRTFSAVLRGSGVEGHPTDDPISAPPAAGEAG